MRLFEESKITKEVLDQIEVNDTINLNLPIYLLNGRS